MKKIGNLIIEFKAIASNFSVATATTFSSTMHLEHCFAARITSAIVIAKKQVFAIVDGQEYQDLVSYFIKSYILQVD